MNASDERTRSLWMDVSVADAPQLRKNISADTVIIGSGIAGLSTAYELALKGQKVVVLDRGRIAGGMTSRTTAHLTSQSDDGFETLIRVRGLEGEMITNTREPFAVAATRSDGSAGWPGTISA